MKLYAPESFWHASVEERKQVCNGCGTKGWSNLLVPDCMWGIPIGEACDIHDWMYFEGQTQDDKNRADRVFLNNLTRLIEGRSENRLFKFLRKRRARTYYMAVKMFGGDAFWADKNMDTDYRDISSIEWG